MIVGMIEQIVTIIIAVAFASFSALVAFMMSRYLTMGWRAIRSEK